MSALLTDLYQLTMLDAYLRKGMDEPAVFELFVRRLPPQRNFLVDADLAWLEGQGGFSLRLLAYLRDFRFAGDVHAMPEGTIVFADEPLLRVTAPLPQAQFVESRLLNIIHFQTLIASKAARIVLAAAGRPLVDFGMRRAHGADAALFAARAAYLAGFAGTATAEAGRRFGMPVFGTMAHSFVQAHTSEIAAFEAFARARPKRPTLLVDTYDTEAAVTKLIDLAAKLALDGIAIGGVRIDSGDLAAHAKAVRRMLDDAGLNAITVLASGNLDEYKITQLLASGAPIDSFGVGTALDTSIDVPALDAVYKLQAYAGVARRKRSEGKATWPGAKQACRAFDASGRMLHDIVQLDDERPAAQPLLQLCMRAGRRVAPAPSLEEIRRYHAAQLRTLPAALRSLEPMTQPYLVDISAGVRALEKMGAGGASFTDSATLLR
jgi:nicotinate phosphoribosyltransferase